MTAQILTEAQDQVLANAQSMYINLGIKLAPGPCLYRVSFPDFDITFSRDHDEFVRVTIVTNIREGTDSEPNRLMSLVNLHTKNHVYDPEIKDVVQLWKDAHLALSLRLAKEWGGKR